MEVVVQRVVNHGQLLRLPDVNRIQPGASSPECHVEGGVVQVGVVQEPSGCVAKSWSCASVVLAEDVLPCKRLVLPVVLV